MTTTGHKSASRNMTDELQAKIKILQAKVDEYVTRIRILHKMSTKLARERDRKNFMIRYESLENTLETLLSTLDEVQLLNVELDPDYMPDYSLLDEVDDMRCEIEQAKSECSKPPKKKERSRKNYCSIKSPRNSIIEGALVDKFENKRKLANFYLSQMFNFKPLSNESPAQLEAFLYKFAAAYEALKQVGVENLSDFIILHLASTKLDKTTLRNFEMSETVRGKEFPEFSDLVLFIEQQSRIL